MYIKPQSWSDYLGHSAKNANDIFSAEDTGYNALFGRLFPEVVSQPLHRGGHRMDPSDVNGILKIIAENILLYQRTSGQFEYSPIYEYPKGALVKFNNSVFLSIREVPVGEMPLLGYHFSFNLESSTETKSSSETDETESSVETESSSETEYEINEVYWKLYSSDITTIAEIQDLIDKSVKSLTQAFSQGDQNVLQVVEDYKSRLDVKDNIHDQKILELQNKDNLLSSWINTNTGNIERHQTLINELQNKDDNLDQDISDLRATDLDLQTQITDLKNTDIEHYRLFSNLQAVDERVNENIERLQEVDEQYRVKLQELDAIDTSVADTLNNVNSRLTSLEETNDSQDDALTNIRNQIDNINTIDNNQNDEIDALTTQLNAVNDSISTLNQDIKSHDNSIEIINNKNQAQDLSITSINDSISRINSTNNAQTQIINDLKTRVENLENSVKSINNRRQNKEIIISGNSYSDVEFENIDYLACVPTLYVLDQDSTSDTYNFYINSEEVGSIAISSEQIRIFNDDNIEHKFLIVIN